MRIQKKAPSAGDRALMRVGIVRMTCYRDMPSHTTALQNRVQNVRTPSHVNCAIFTETLVDKKAVNSGRSVITVIPG